MAADSKTAAPTAGKLLAKQMVAGASAGTLADAIMFPMMTVKSRLQVQGGGGGYSYKGPVDAISSIAAREGWRTLYKGFGTVCLIAPAQALYLGTYQTSKKVLPGGQDNPLTQFFGGAISTLVQSSVMVPTEVIRQRQMVQTAQEGAYTGSLHAIRTIYQHEGIAAFYRGFLLAQLVWGPYNAVYLPLWEGLKRTSVRFSGAESMQKLEVQYELGSAFIAASVAAALTNPADIVKTRLQVQGKSNKSSATQYTGTIDAARKIYAKEGIAGFTKGMSSRVLWVAPSATIMFTSYDQLMKRLERMW
ncbi:unnamed protein product [Calypogeia fissa]